MLRWKSSHSSTYRFLWFFFARNIQRTLFSRNSKKKFKVSTIFPKNFGKNRKSGKSRFFSKLTETLPKWLEPTKIWKSIKNNLEMQNITFPGRLDRKLFDFFDFWPLLRRLYQLGQIISDRTNFFSKMWRIFRWTKLLSDFTIFVIFREIRTFLEEMNFLILNFGDLFQIKSVWAALYGPNAVYYAQNSILYHIVVIWIHALHI